MAPTFGGAAALKTGKLSLGLPGMQLQNTLSKPSVSPLGGKGPSITTQIIIEGTSSDDDDSEEKDICNLSDKEPAGGIVRK